MTTHKHAALMAQYAQDAMETETPWERWEHKPNEANYWIQCGDNTCFFDGSEYRRKPNKPRTMMLGGMEMFIKIC
jgi:hypothetical protein